jgi:dihydroorotase
MSDDDKLIPLPDDHTREMAEAGILLDAGARVIAAQEKEKQVMAALLDDKTDQIAHLKAELAHMTRARDIACFNVADLNHQRSALTAVLDTALQLIEYLLNEMRAGGVVPSVACQLAKKTLDDKMARLFDLGPKQ